MISEPMPAALLCALLPMIEPSWRAKGAVVQVIGSREGGAWWTSSEIGDCLDREAGTVRRIVAQLAADRVILRDGGVGGGDHARRFWVEVNPDWGSWRVPWRFPIATVRQRVAWASHDASLGAIGRFIARPYVARYPETNARLWARDTALREALGGQLSRDIGTRDNGAAGGAYRASEGGLGRDRAPLSRDIGTRDNSEGAPKKKKESSSSRSRDVDLSSSSAPTEGVETVETVEGVVVESSAWQAAKRAVLVRAVGPGGRRKFLKGDPARQVAALTARHGAEAVVAAAASIVAGVEMVPRFVDLLGDVLAGVDDDRPPGASERGRDEPGAYVCRECHVEFPYEDQLSAGGECWACLEAAPGARPAPTIVGQPTRDPTIRDHGDTESDQPTGNTTRMRVRSPR